MSSKVQYLKSQGLIGPPSFVHENLCYETLMGSVAYGVSDVTSDVDIYGFCLPKKNLIFPHLGGEILGFGKQIKRFEQYQEHHILDRAAKKEYDIVVYSIVKYFQLAMDNNPNIIDSLFTPIRAVTYSSAIGEMVRDKREIFLHKGSFHKFRGYAHAQIHKLNNKKATGKRKELVEQHGYDTKFAYNIIRLVLEAQQILVEHNIDLERDRELLKTIRRGDWTKKEVIEWFSSKEKELENLYLTSDLRHKPDEAQIKKLLINCIEHHYGSIDKAIHKPSKESDVIEKISSILDDYR